METTATCPDHPALVAIGDCNSCGRPVCVNCGTTVEGKVHCTSCRPDLAHTAVAARRGEDTQRWYAVWSLVLWAVGLTFFIVNMILPESASDEAFGIVFLGVIVSLPAGLALGILALRGQSQKHRGKATVGVVVNSLTLAVYVLLTIIGLAVTLE